MFVGDASKGLVDLDSLAGIDFCISGFQLGGTLLQLIRSEWATWVFKRLSCQRTDKGRYIGIAGCLGTCCELLILIVSDLNVLHTTIVAHSSNRCQRKKAFRSFGEATTTEACAVVEPIHESIVRGR